MICSSVDWYSTEKDLYYKSKGLRNTQEIKKLIKNIESSIVKLSKVEVVDRRNKTVKSKELLDKINNDIEMVNEFILVAKLLG